MRSSTPEDYPAAHSMDTAWFGVDADGNLAMFDTGEDGILPLEPMEGNPSMTGEGAYWEALAAIAAALGHDEEEDLMEPEFLTELGLYAYATDYGLVPYERGPGPEAPLRLDDLPAHVVHELAWMPLPQVRFAEAESIQPAEFATAVTTWSNPDAGYLSADGTTRRAIPGQEAGFKAWFGTDALELPEEEAIAITNARVQERAAQQETNRQRTKVVLSLLVIAAVAALLAWAL